MLDLAFRDLRFPRLGRKTGTGGGGAVSAIVGNSTTIVADGQTITLSVACDYGYDQIGRAFVVTPPGGMNIISRTPAATAIDAVANSGTMLNPQANGNQGWDARTGRYTAGLNQSFPFAVVPGDIVVTSIAGPTPTIGTDPTRQGYFASVQPFYFVAAGWNTKAIAPTPIGWAGRPTPQPWYVDCLAIVSAGSFPNFDITGFPSIPAKVDYLARAQRNEVGLWMNHGTSNGGYQQLTTQGVNGVGQSNYGSDLAKTYEKVDFLLCSNGLTLAEKATLLAWRISHGLMYDTWAGAADPFVSDGGQWQPNFASEAMALYYTGRSSLLPTMQSEAGGNYLLQHFIWTAGMVSELSPHSDMNKIWLGRTRQISGVSGNNFSISTNHTASNGDPGKFGITGLNVKRISDGVKVRITAQDDPDSIVTGVGTFGVATLGHTFANGEDVILEAQDPVREGFVDWRAIPDIQNIHPGAGASYRDENTPAGAVDALRAQGIWSTGPGWEEMELYSARGNMLNDPQNNDYSQSSSNAFALAFRNAFGPTILGDKPLFLSRPTITGNLYVGEVLTATTGIMAGAAPITNTWQWYRGETPISGATSSTYTPVSGDLTFVLSVEQTATNAQGTRKYRSITTAAITSGFTLNAVEFDGTTTWAHASGLSPTTPDKRGTLLLSFKAIGTIGTPARNVVNFFSGTSERVSLTLSRNTGGAPPTDRGYLNLVVRNDTPAVVIANNTQNGAFLVDTWYTVAYSWDTATSTLHKWVKPDGGAWVALGTQGSPTMVADGLTGTVNSMCIGADAVGGANKLQNWFAAEVIYAQGVFLDLTDSAVRARLVPNIGKGSDGSVAMGAAPYLYLSGATATWHNNKAAGGGLTKVGTLTTAPNVPA